MTNDPEHGQISETTGLDEDRVQGDIQGEEQPSTSAIRSQDGPPDAELTEDQHSEDERTDDDPEDAREATDVEDSERRVGWEEE